jgi:hypothetical protein
MLPQRDLQQRPEVRRRHCLRRGRRVTRGLPPGNHGVSLPGAGGVPVRAARMCGGRHLPVPPLSSGAAGLRLPAGWEVRRIPQVHCRCMHGRSPGGRSDATGESQMLHAVQDRRGAGQWQLSGLPGGRVDARLPGWSRLRQGDLCLRGRHVHAARIAGQVSGTGRG